MFSELMNDAAGIQIHTTDNDPGATKGVGNWVCGSNVNCVWNAGHTGLIVTVTATTPPAGASSDGSTPGLQLPLTITSTNALSDFNDNVAPNLSLSDTLIDAPAAPQLNVSSGTSLVSVFMGQSMCNTSPFTVATDFTVTVNGNPVAITEVRRPQGTNLATSTTCDAPRGAAVGPGFASFTSINLGIATPLANGDFVSATITCTATDGLGCAAGGASKIQDLIGNVLPGALTVTGTATPDTTRPSISLTTTLFSAAVRLTFSEPVLCGTGNAQGFTVGFLQQFTITVGGTSNTPTSVTCPASSTIGATRITLNSPADLSTGGSVTYQESATSAERIKDLSGNNATSPQTISFAPVPTAIAPLITDAHVTVNVVSTNFGDIGDAFSLAFNEQMNNNIVGVQTQATDNDPGPTKDFVTWTCGTNVTCNWNPLRTVLTVTVTTATVAFGGSTPGLQLPLTITATTGLTDSNDGVAPNLAASDTLIDVVPLATVTPPLITDAHVVVNIGSTNFGDVSDVFTVTFNEQMNDIPGIQIQTRDNDPGTIKDVVTWLCATNANCTWNTARTVLTVNVSTPVIGFGGTTPGLQLPLTVTATTNLSDAQDFVAPNLAASDKSID